MRIEEQIDFTDAEFVEESGQRIIKGVCLLGSKSAHGYSYPDEVMVRAIQDNLYEGVRCYVNHDRGGGVRDVMDLAGMVENARHEPGRIRGDIRLLPDAPGKKVWDISQMMPRCAGFSHVADGRLGQRDGKKVVEAISRVFSVDLVATPATTGGMYEGDEPGMVSVPRPMEKERQFDFIARCVAEIQAGNDSITDAQATAMAFAAWTSRYEAEDEDGGYLTVQIPAPAQEEDQPITHHDHIITAERQTAMKTINEELSQQHANTQDANAILSLDQSTERVVRQHEQAAKLEAYEAEIGVCS